MVAIDRDALHRLLYGRADHFGRYKMDLAALAGELGLSYCNFSVVIRAMTDEGRLRRIAGTTYGRKTYHVEPPDAWLAIA